MNNPSDPSEVPNSPWLAYLDQAATTENQLSRLQAPPREPIVGEWFKAGDLGFIYGPRGLGKTWFALLLARKCAEGVSMADWTVHQPRRVLYVDDALRRFESEDEDEKDPITPKIACRVSERMALGLPVPLALAAETNPHLTEEQWNAALKRDPRLASAVEASKARFCDYALRQLFAGCWSANIRIYLAGRRQRTRRQRHRPTTTELTNLRGFSACRTNTSDFYRKQRRNCNCVAGPRQSAAKFTNPLNPITHLTIHPFNQSMPSILPDHATPDLFAENVLGMKLYPKQRDVLRALAQRGAAVSFRSCNEGGKTKRVICAAILWHLIMFRRGHVISTSGCFRQIKDQLMPALHAHGSKFPDWTFLRTPRIETQNVQCFYEGFSTDEGGKFEGHHAGGPDEPLLIIVDEAKTVKDDIFQAIERCKPTRLLIASSPGCAEGEFYRSQTTRKKFYQTFIQRATECPHWKPEDIARLRDKWGEEHPLFKSMVMADFMESVSDAVVDMKALEDLLANPPPVQKANGAAARKAFCDFAWGGDGDENVLALRDGNVVTIEEAFHADNLHAICGQFIAAFRRLGLQAHQIDGDEGGGGKLICDQLAAMGWRIHRVNNGAAPRNCDHYANVAAEIWFEGAQKIVRREIILPDDDDLRAQMLDRKRVPNARGKLALESKTDMRKRGVPSPDRADAVFGAMTSVRRLESVNISNARDPRDGIKEQWAEWGRNEEFTPPIPGAWFG